MSPTTLPLFHERAEVAWGIIMSASLAEDLDLDTKACPFCGEEIKSVAIRCKHCQADLTKPPPAAAAGKASEADFTRGVAAEKEKSKESPADFEQRFLEFAYKTNQRLDALSVAHACKVPIAEADERLEDMAAREVLIREVDDEGQVFFRLPGRGKQEIVRTPAGPLAKVDESTALVGLLVNLPLPGVGSLIAGKTKEGVLQLVMLGVGLPLCFVLIGFPLIFGAWVWALVTGIKAVNEAKGSNFLP
jgi:TM2 domain-containing membrane protein YozV